MAVLRCERADGSVTWQRQTGPRAAFFPLHDLTHYAAETVLGIADGFFGLLASGWDIEDTTGKGRRGPLPPAAILVEHLVGLLDLERATGTEWAAQEFCAQLRAAGVAMSPAIQDALTDRALAQIRSTRRDLFARWAATGPGDRMELVFPGGASAGVDLAPSRSTYG